LAFKLLTESQELWDPAMANLSPIQFQATVATAGNEFLAPVQEENSGVFLGELKDALGLQLASQATENQNGEKDETSTLELNVDLLGLQILPETALLALPAAANFASSDSATAAPAALDAQALFTSTDMLPVLPTTDTVSLALPTTAQALASASPQVMADSADHAATSLSEDARSTDTTDAGSAATPLEVIDSPSLAATVPTTGAVTLAPAQARAAVAPQNAGSELSLQPSPALAKAPEAPQVRAQPEAGQNLSLAQVQTPIKPSTLAANTTQSVLLTESGQHVQTTSLAVASQAAAPLESSQTRAIDPADTLAQSTSPAPAPLASRDEGLTLASVNLVDTPVAAAVAPDKPGFSTDAQGQRPFALAEQSVAPTSVVTTADASPVLIATQRVTFSEAVSNTAPSGDALAPALTASSVFQVAQTDPKDLSRPLNEAIPASSLLSSPAAVPLELGNDNEFKPVTIDPSQAQTSFTSTLLGQFTAQHAQAPAHQVFEPTNVPAPLEPHQVQLDAGEVKVEIMRLVKQGGGQIVMELTPPDQSKFRIDLKIDAQGVASLVVEGASDSTRSRLERGAEGLQEQFAEMGLALQLDMRQSHDPGAQREAMQQMQSSFTPSGTLSRATASTVTEAQRSRSVGEGQVHIYA
jgi:hypothetical protein